MIVTGRWDAKTRTLFPAALLRSKTVQRKLQQRYHISVDALALAILTETCCKDLFQRQNPASIFAHRQAPKTFSTAVSKI